MDLNAKSLDWAIKAKEKVDKRLIKEGLLPDTSAVSRDQFRIALLGKAQSGKTRLALLLLGAREQQLDELDECLRSGREAGKSVTVLPTVYYASDKKYEIKLFDDRTLIEQNLFANKKELSDYLEKLRGDIKNKSSSKKDINFFLRIGLPINIQAGLASEVIDLVGLDSKEAWERWLSKEISDKFLKYADIPVLVVRSNQISSTLDSQDENIKKLVYKWESVPLPKRIIVVTFALRPKNIRNDLQKEKKARRLFDYTKRIYIDQIEQTTDVTFDDSSQETNSSFKLIPIDSVCPDFLHRNKRLWRGALNTSIEELYNEVDINPDIFKIRTVFDYKPFLQKKADEDIRLVRGKINDKKNTRKREEENKDKLNKDINRLQKNKDDVDTKWMNIVSHKKLNISIKSSCPTKKKLLKKELLKFDNEVEKEFNLSLL